MIGDAIRDTVRRFAIGHGVDPLLALAIVEVESGGNPWAFRPEPRYPYLWDVRHGHPFRSLDAVERASSTPPGDFPFLAGDRAQEWVLQRSSFGLMQVMGALARERGFAGSYLTELFDVETNLAIGCGHLGELLRWCGHDEEKTVGSWNAGRAAWDSPAGQAYRAKVRTALNRERE